LYSNVADVKKTHYEVLGLTESASPADIREAFVSLSKQVHPDINPSDPDNHAKFIRLSEAYMVLSKPLSRQEYDMSLGRWNHQSTGGSHQYQQYRESEGVSWQDAAFINRETGATYQSDSYYGIKGVRRMPNYVIAFGCLGLIAVGFGYFFIGYRYSMMKQRRRMDMDKKNMQLLRESRENARTNGWQRQLEILQEKSDSTKYYINNVKPQETGAQKSDRGRSDSPEEG
jgi:curved DNA-binding protein CbpA